MSSKRVSFASALVCAAFVPQAMGACASGNSGAALDKVAKTYKGHLGNGKDVIAPKGGETDDDFDGEDFGFNVQTKKRTVKGNSIFSKVLGKASSFKKRYGKLVDLSKKVAVYGGLGYSIINFTGPTVDIISKKSALDKNLIPNGVGQNISGLMLNPNVDFRFLLNDVDEDKKLSEEGKKEAVGDIAKFLSAFEKMYKSTGSSFDVEKFETGIESDFDVDKDSDRMNRFCKNLRSLPRESIAKNLGLDAKLLNDVSVREYKKVNSLLKEAGKSEYHGFGNGSEDALRDVNNMWSGGRDVAVDIGGEGLSTLGNSLTMALSGPNKLYGIALIVAGTVCKYFSNERKMNEQKNMGR